MHYLIFVLFLKLFDDVGADVRASRVRASGKRVCFRGPSVRAGRAFRAFLACLSGLPFWPACLSVCLPACLLACLPVPYRLRRNGFLV